MILAAKDTSSTRMYLLIYYVHEISRYEDKARATCSLKESRDLPPPPPALATLSRIEEHVFARDHGPPVIFTRT